VYLGEHQVPPCSLMMFKGITTGYSWRRELPYYCVIVLSRNTGDHFRSVMALPCSGLQLNVYAALVYDISNRQSFETIEWWFAVRSQHAPKSAVKILVGNKTDNVCFNLVSTVLTLKRSPHRNIRGKFLQLKVQPMHHAWGCCSWNRRPKQLRVCVRSFAIP
jgi:hypothetical protein